ncbi:50S ribosomal protein L15 [Mycoplasma struthionis]|uniref:Large ribosomal subunit protein uL15 n=1 Tax=Mycoplasma struthionis TaxID=538220 RepID=A0A3G8LJC4_9MOLU|nr:50S ribosomal protein L15 [Mycoplasma struthionis]AZG68748.1 50S ribosomal protein L15 [Mycoplasma struthionis]TPI01866.1 50S ribosomal protein L15 [Mycoplasma struthionis]
MELHNLKATPGARKAKHRVGRGHAAGKGKQAGRGQSGQTKRSTVRLGFEGGQLPLFRRIPKRGFNNVNHVEYQVVNLVDLERTYQDGEVVSYESLASKNLIKRAMPVKILANGKLTKKLIVEVPTLSAAAKVAIEKNGGKIEVK